jgi:putative endonuclease
MDTKNNKFWYVYIAKTRTGRYYTGISNDVEKRIIKHNSGKGSMMAKQQGPFTLVYKSISFMNKSEARKREVQIKKWSRIKKEKLISGEWN